MSGVRQSAHDRLIREVANRYIRQGYPVQVEPGPTDLPDFLSRFQPDLIVTTPEGKIVVEVKSRGKARQVDYWQALTDAINNQPGWEVRFVTDNQREEELFSAEQPILSQDEIEERLTASEQLARNGLLDSALLITWASIEALLRDASRKEKQILPNQGTGPLITWLYAEGGLDRADYDSLMSLLKFRNQAVHGFRVEQISPTLVEQAQSMARRLLKQKTAA